MLFKTFFDQKWFEPYLDRNNNILAYIVLFVKFCKSAYYSSNGTHWSHWTNRFLRS